MNSSVSNKCWALLPLLLCQCPASDGRKAVVVTPLAPRLAVPVARYRITASLDGKPASIGPKVVEPDRVPFTLVLPEGATGRLQVALEGASSSALQVATGQGSVTIDEQLDYRLEIPLEQPACRSWCVQVPASRGLSLKAVWGAAPDDVWAVGERGTVLRYDGFSWRSIDSRTQADLYAVWGSGPVVWYAGDGGTLVRAGSEPETHEHSQSIRGLWGSGPADIWAVGLGAQVLHYDGAKWVFNGPDVGVDLQGVWGSGPADVWAVGDRGTIAHYDGKGWTPDGASGMATAQTLYAIWGAGRGDAWAVGESGVLLRLQGGLWKLWPSTVRESLYAIWGGGGELHAAGSGVVLRWDGGRWSQEQLAAPVIHGLGGVGPVWAVGAPGVLAFFEGGAWNVVHRGPEPMSSARGGEVQR